MGDASTDTLAPQGSALSEIDDFRVLASPDEIVRFLLSAVM
jgi:hypothetical protein